MSRPLIAVSGSWLRDSGGAYVDLMRSYVNHDYNHAVEVSGGLPYIVPFTENLDVAREAMRHVDGLVLSGGHDVYPLHYGEEPLQGIGDVWPERDQFDFALLQVAEERRIPVLAICRGAQILNVYRGGSLFQDLRYDANCTLKHVQGQTPSLGTHTVSIEENSILHKAVGVTSWVTNSHHHQTIHRLGENLIVTATAQDGTIEGIEDPSYPWMVAVQFHPEMMVGRDGRAQQLFQTFIEAAVQEPHHE